MYAILIQSVIFSKEQRGKIMKDHFGRNIDYMRISLTDRCNFRCYYCTDPNMVRVSHDDILRYEEILTICQTAIALGIHNFKITGGEPFSRRGCLSLIKNLKSLPGCRQVTLTTNGSFPSETLEQLQKIGIDGINFSLDTLDPAKFASITRSTCYQHVIDNILRAANMGLPIKINTVLLDELTRSDILDLVEFAGHNGIPLRFIELMPMKDEKRGHRTKQDVLSILIEEFSSITATDQKLGNGPASYYKVNGNYIGFIEPLHGKFCHLCNRVRLTSTGFLKTCLFHTDGTSLRPFVNTDKLYDVMKDTIEQKPKQHDFEHHTANHTMNSIGG
jgi:cyclic pyranopterin phosphate synthase